MDEAGLAGVTVGDHEIAPRLTKAMLAEADARGFPVLVTGSETPFAAIGRTVAAANTERQTMGVLLLSKLYQAAAQLDVGARRSGSSLRDIFGTDITVVDDETGCIVIGTGVLAPPDARRHALRTQRPTSLAIGGERQLDGFSLVHLSQVLAVDANSILQEATEAIRQGTDAVDRALAGRRDGEVALDQIWNAETAGYRVIVIAGDFARRLALAVALAGLPPTSTTVNGRTVLVATIRDIPLVRRILAEVDARAGVSAEHRDLADIGGAVAEASSEFSAAVAQDDPWREYEGEHVSLLARSHTELLKIVQSVLGPLAGDDPRHIPLRQTLFAFLDNDMRWNVTAATLGLHRQSLVYRLSQVEKLTGRSVRRTQDVAELWLARKAWEQSLSRRDSSSGR